MTYNSGMEEKSDTTHLPTILIVEDDLEIGFILAQALKEEILAHILLATDGFQALQMLRAIHPTLCIFDYRLPRMDGLELVDHLRATECCSQIPIVFMSANLPKQAVEERGLMGIEKPFDLYHLADMIKGLISVK